MKKLRSVMFIVSFSLALSASAETVTLQEGVDSYNGCTDSYIHNSGYQTDNSTNFGNSPSLMAVCWRYST